MKKDSQIWAIIHCRVSDRKQTAGESLKSQEEACRYIAKQRLNIDDDNIDVRREVLSGRKDERPLFEDILKDIDSSAKNYKYYIIRAIDRFTRTGGVGYGTMKKELSKRGIELIDSYGIIQPPTNTLEHLGYEYDWSKYSSSEGAELQAAQEGKAEVTRILTRTIGAEISLTKEGYKIRRPDEGYINKKIWVGGKKKTVQAPDPERAHFYIAMFNMRAEGILSDKEIVEKLNGMGYHTRTYNKWNSRHEKIIGTVGGRPLTVKQMQRFVIRPIFAGVMCEKWTNYQPIIAQYKGLVSIETFNKANRGKIFIEQRTDGTLRMLHDYDAAGKNQPHRMKNNPLYPLRFILCPYCSKNFLGSASRGKSGKIHPSYHCSRGHKYYGIPKIKFEENIRKYVRDLRFDAQFMDKLETKLLNKYREEEKRTTEDSAQYSKHIAELKDQKSAAGWWVSDERLVKSFSWYLCNCFDVCIISHCLE
jgi:site-specific DNA recombinase